MAACDVFQAIVPLRARNDGFFFLYYPHFSAALRGVCLTSLRRDRDGAAWPPNYGVDINAKGQSAGAGYSAGKMPQVYLGTLAGNEAILFPGQLH